MEQLPTWTQSNMLYNRVEYVPASELINEVKNMLSSYFNSNQLDESILYPKLRWCLSKFKANHKPHKWCLMKIENYKGELPEYFDKMCLALGCTDDKAHGCVQEPSRWQETINTEEQHVCSLNLCESIYDVCHDSCGNMFKIVQKFDRFPTNPEREAIRDVMYTKFFLLCPDKSSQFHCILKSPNLKSRAKQDIRINKGLGTVDTNFESGLIYMQYSSDYETEDDYLVPNNATITEWIKAEMIAVCFQNMFYNGEPNIQGRYQDAKQDQAIKFEQARSIYKASEFNEFYNLANTLTRRYRASKWATWDPQAFNTVGHYNYRTDDSFGRRRNRRR